MRSEPDAPALERAIPLCVPEIQGNEWKYVKECLDTNWVSSAGSYVDRFERAVADYTGARYAVATVNGTAALHVAVLAAGVEPGDEVLVPTLSFIAPANAVRYAGAWPVFMDAEPLYWQMDPGKVKDFLEKECLWEKGRLLNKSTCRRIKAVLPVHILGHPCDMDPLLGLARRYHLAVIEDAAESLGARYKGRRAGCLGDIAVLSFNGNKIITAGGGGMILTNHEGWADRARYWAAQAKNDSEEGIHGEIGYNYRLTNIQAALGCAQMERLDHHIAAKRRIAAAYAQALEPLSWITPMPEAEWAFSIFWMYTVLIKQDRMDRREVLRRLAEARIQARPLWQPLHRSGAHRDCQAYRCESAEQLNERAVSLPCSVGLSESDQLSVLAELSRLCP